jgi:hypothetical protein
MDGRFALGRGSGKKQKKNGILSFDEFNHVTMNKL